MNAKGPHDTLQTSPQTITKPAPTALSFGRAPWPFSFGIHDRRFT